MAGYRRREIMQAKGIPDTVAEARGIVNEVASFTANTGGVAHWPHSQIIALAQCVVDLADRLAEVEARRGPGRPPKVRETVSVDRVKAEMAS
jgi:hypothetical protein